VRETLPSNGDTQDQGGRPIRTDSAIFQDGEHLFARPPGSQRICAIGQPVFVQATAECNGYRDRDKRRQGWTQMHSAKLEDEPAKRS
jgi:hypothetical protein